jgi:hypothetical protein
MKRFTLILLAILIALTGGCAGKQASGVRSADKGRLDVFQEVDGKTGIADGDALLDISFSVKHNSSRMFWQINRHPDAEFTVHLAIDGQTIILQTEPTLETTKGDHTMDPEVGTGWRYVFKKELLLKPGRHRLSVALPAEKIFVEQEIALPGGSSSLVIEPVYHSTMQPRKHADFSSGLKTVVIKQ